VRLRGSFFTECVTHVKVFIEKISHYLDTKWDQDNFSKLSVNHRIQETEQKPKKVKEQ